jgi:hypothetical protein
MGVSTIKLSQVLSGYRHYPSVIASISLATGIKPKVFEVAK